MDCPGNLGGTCEQRFPRGDTAIKTFPGCLWASSHARKKMEKDNDSEAFAGRRDFRKVVNA